MDGESNYVAEFDVGMASQELDSESDIVPFGMRGIYLLC